MQKDTQFVTINYILIDSQEELGREKLPLGDEQAIRQKIEALTDKGYEVTDRLISPNHYGEMTLFLREKESVVAADYPKKAGESVPFSEKLKWPAGLAVADLNRSLRRTILFKKEDGTSIFDPIVQEIHLRRAALVNHATGKVSYMPWRLEDQEAVFAEVSAPFYNGYTPTPGVVSKQQIEDYNSADQEISIVYHAQVHKALIRVVDIRNGHVLFEDSYTGKTGEAVAYPISSLVQRYVASGYEIVSNDLKENRYFGEEDGQEFILNVQPRVILFEAQGSLPVAGEPIYPDLEGSVKWPKGLQATDLMKYVSRTLIFKDESGEEVRSPYVQRLAFKRQAQVNLVTGSVTYAHWQSEQDSFPAYEPEDREGYFAKPRMIAALHGVTGYSESRTETIEYVKKLQKIEIQFLDKSRNHTILYKTQISGKSGDPIQYNLQEKLQEFLNIGYEVVSNDYPTEGIFGYNIQEIPIYTVELSPKIVAVGASRPHQVGSFVGSNEQGPRWPAGVGKDDLVRSVTRRIRHVGADGQELLPDVVDTVEFRRNAQVNLVTGHVIYNEWDITQSYFEQYDVPEIEGYERDRGSVLEQKVTEQSSDLEYEVHYVANLAPFTVKIYDIDTSRVLLERQFFTSKIKEIEQELELLVQPFLEIGYAYNEESSNKRYLFEEESRIICVNLRPLIQTVKPDKPQLPYMPIEGYDRLTWPQGVGELDLNKTISRLILFKLSTGEEVHQPIEQVASFTRTAYVHMPTAKVSYSEWEEQEQRFDFVTVPKLSGYTPDRGFVEEMSVSGEQHSQVIQITYSRSSSPILIRYIDSETDALLVEEKIEGSIDEVVTYNIEKRIVALGLVGYDVLYHKIPEKLIIQAKEQCYVISLREKVFELSYENYDSAFRDSNFSHFKLLQLPIQILPQNLMYTSYRHIHYVYEEGGQAFDDYIQKCQFVRTAQVGLVSGTIRYTPWKSLQSGLDSVSSPVLPGYEADKLAVPAMTLESVGESEILEETVIYSQVPSQFEVSVRDISTGQELEKLHLIIRAGEVSRYQLDQLVGHYTNLGYELVETRVPDPNELTHLAISYVELLLQPRYITISLDDFRQNFRYLDELSLRKVKSRTDLTVHSLLRKISRRIEYMYTDGNVAAPSVENEVLFERQAYFNLVTEEISFSEWESQYPIFDEVISPLISGYRANKEVSSSVESVQYSDGNLVEKVIYHPQIQDVLLRVVDRVTGDLLYSESIDSTLPQSTRIEDFPTLLKYSKEKDMQKEAKAEVALTESVEDVESSNKVFDRFKSIFKPH